ncbi:MAG: hypothetical protein WBN96_01665, partial [Gammaproteobacteria bacterium]
MGYLLIAFVVVQSISGLLHVDLHSSGQEPDITHHHYPVLSTLDDINTSVQQSHGLVKLDLQLDSSLGSKLATPLFALLFTYLMLAIGRNSTRSRTIATSVPLTPRIY